MPLRYKKKFGQHFLKRPPQSLLNFFSNITKDNIKTLIIVETGPGEGALTYPVLNFLQKAEGEQDKLRHKLLRVFYYAFEVDKELTLATSYQEVEHNKKVYIDFEVIYENILNVNLVTFLKNKLDLSKFNISKTAIVFISSLPYYISKEIIIKQAIEFCQLNHQFGLKKGFFWYIAQKEVVQSFLSKPPHATFLGNVLKLFSNGVVKKELLPGQAFVPPPRVDSLVFMGHYKPKFDFSCQDVQRFISCIRKFFAYSRKKIQKICKILNMQISLTGDFMNKRPQELTLAEWQLLCNEVM